MIEKALNEFLSSIAPYLKFWGSLRVSGAAVNLDGMWFNLCIRVTFVADAPTRKEVHSPEPRFLHYVVDFPIAAVEQVTREIVLGGEFDLQSGDGNSGAHARIIMKREMNNPNAAPPIPMQWSTPIIQEPGASGETAGPKQTSITIRGYGQYVTDVLSYELARKIEARLRTATPCYDGLTGLFAHIIPGVSYTGNGNTRLEIVAELPFDVQKGERDLIFVEGPSRVPVGSLELRSFFGPGPGLPANLTGLEPANAQELAERRLRWTYRPTWPEGSGSARIVLFFESEHVQTLEVKRWPNAGNIRELVDAYFDPAHERLKAALLARGSMNQQAFELAVARLLNLLGLPTVWYGKGATEAKPDLAAFIEDGPVLLCECTLEKPVTKFSGLAERARHLQEQIGQGDVLSIVFTRAQVVESEKQQAHEHGIAIVGQSELHDLLKIFESGSVTKESLAYLQGLRSNPNIEFGGLLNGRWAPRW